MYVCMYAYTLCLVLQVVGGRLAYPSRLGMHVCMYACMHVCMYAYPSGLGMYVCMYIHYAWSSESLVTDWLTLVGSVCMHLRLCMYVCMYVCIYVYCD